MADATLTAEIRSAKGKGPAGRTRRDGLVPAVVYGLGEQTVSVSVSAREPPTGVSRFPRFPPEGDRGHAAPS